MAKGDSMEKTSERLQKLLVGRPAPNEKLQRQMEYLNKLKASGVLRPTTYDVKPMTTI
jgi:hypothetical protein